MPTYDFSSLGKVLLVVLQKIDLLGKPIDTKELEHFSMYTKKLPSVLSSIALSQLRRMETFNTTRESHVAYYAQILQKYYPDMLKTHAPLLRLPLLVYNPLLLKQFARKHNVYLGDWY